MAVRIQLRVIPNASVCAYVGLMDDGFTHKIKLTAPPVDGKANKSLLRFLADSLRLPKNAIVLISGASSRNKVVEVSGLSEAEVVQRLAQIR